MTEQEQNIPVQVVVDKNRLKHHLERILIECSNSVFYGIAAIESLEKSPEYLFGEDEFLMHSPMFLTMSLDDGKKFFKNWLIKKGFEDLIKGVSLMLIDVCTVIRKQEKLLKVKPKTLEEMKVILDLPEHQIHREHLPKLIEIIKPFLNSELSYTEEIDSINRVRRCLVHRDGFVLPIDFQNGTDFLQLKWVYSDMTYEEDGVQTKLQPFILMTAKGTIKLVETKRSQDFKENERIEIGYQLFNELIWTCFRFGEDLIYKLSFNQK